MPDNDKFIIIERRKYCPPEIDETEVIYSGEPIGLKDIPKKCNLNPEEQRSMFYNIYRIELKKNEISFSVEDYDFNEVVEGHIKVRPVLSLPLDPTKKILENLLKRV